MTLSNHVYMYNKKNSKRKLCVKRDAGNAILSKWSETASANFAAYNAPDFIKNDWFCSDKNTVKNSCTKECKRKI